MAFDFDVSSIVTDLVSITLLRTLVIKASVSIFTFVSVSENSFSISSAIALK